MTKKSLLVWIAALSALVWVLTGCGQDKIPETTWTAAQMAEAILISQDQTDGIEQIVSGEDAFGNYLTNYYGMNPVDVSEGAILYAGGTSALEIAVLRLAGTEDVDGAVETLQAYIEARAGAFTGYLPEQAAIVEQSSAASRGIYVALLICENQQAALDAFGRCFEGAEPPADSSLPIDSQDPNALSTPAPADNTQPDSDADTDTDLVTSPEASPELLPEDGPDTPPTEPEPAQEPEDRTEPESAPVPDETPEPAPTAVPDASANEPEPDAPWSYSGSRLVTAWKAGDWSNLHQRDREILDICDSVIQSLIRADMADYDKELAIHDWMIDWASYDSDTLSHQQNAQPNPDNDNPYGFLTGKKGICLGYTSTFQLFMDMLGIQCVTVSGTAYSGSEAHAWNMVNLDGEWYCVDVTWDDPTTYGAVSNLTAHRYFNVTSDFLRKQDHQWDETSVSEADATTYAWNPYA